MLLLGYDIGSSSIKATLLNAQTGSVVASATSPKKEMPMQASQPGWAEQPPEMWWEHIKNATAELKQQSPISLAEVKAMGVAYQMHGLVIVDKNQQVLRPAIIWCDSRAVAIGAQAAREMGPETCLKHMFNSPGNFTASKLKWVKDNEPDIYRRIHKMMLPGDYVAMKLTGQIKTTVSGLSEGILWDFKNQAPARLVMDNYGFDPALLPELCPTFGPQGELSATAAEELGLPKGISVAYRAGDQPNNALSLNVLQPGEVAATAGTSGVVYGVSGQPNYDAQSRVNIFAHVNHLPNQARYGVLLCVNGTGILNSWLKHNVMGAGQDYSQMNDLAIQTPVGAEGLVVLPYGNGAERSLGNANINASIHGLNFNIHQRGHVLRAAQEGIVFALNYGLEIMRDLGINISRICAGDANMFLSPLFGAAFATVTGARVELYNTDGSQGSARGAGMGAGIYKDASAAFAGLKTTRVIEPDPRLAAAYRQAYGYWRSVLNQRISG